MPRLHRIAIVCAVLFAAPGCGPSEVLPIDPGVDGPKTLSALDHTPGYFRDTFRAREAQRALDDATVAAQHQLELQRRVSQASALPPLSAADEAMLEALWAFGAGAVEATIAEPARARRIGDLVIDLTLGLDPALELFNAEGGDAPLTAATAASFTSAAQQAVALAAGQDTACATATTPAAAPVFDPGEPQAVWIEEECSPDEWVDGYCEPDTYIEGDCYDTWVPEDCSGGRWVDKGYWYYDCYTYDECEYVWVPRWVYEEGVCDAGYWETWCDDGYWEDGLCYDGYWEEGECWGGYTVYEYPNGSWTLPAAAPPPGCEEERPPQFAVALQGIEAVDAFYEADLHRMWQSALEDLLARVEPGSVDESTYQAMLLVLDSLE